MARMGLDFPSWRRGGELFSKQIRNSAEIQENRFNSRYLGPVPGVRGEAGRIRYLGG